MSQSSRRGWRSIDLLVAPVACLASALVLTTALGASVRAGQAPAAAQAAPAPTAALTDQEMEKFLLSARIVRTRAASKGVTGTTRATLSDGTLTHDASVQTIDEEKSRFETASGTEFNFKDSWKFNVAGYRLDRLIGLNMVPVSVPRRFETKMGSYTWWVDDVLMDEVTRVKKNISAPDTDLWNEQVRLVRVFDQLVFNTDSNLTNLLITTKWRVWPIDYGRAFRRHKELMSAENLTHCDRQVLEKMKALDRPMLDKALKDVLSRYEIEGILARRDLIVKAFEAKGPSALFDRRPVPQAP